MGAARRARVTAWLIFLLFGGLLLATVVMQVVAPQPPRQFGFLPVGFTVFTLLATYYLIFAFWYRVELTEEELSLHRLLLPTRRIAWREIAAFRLEPDYETLTLHSASGTKVAIYASLNGLSAVRRCLAAFTPLSQTSDSWATADPTLIDSLPAWRCHELDLEDNPFAPLGSWQRVMYKPSAGLDMDCV